MTSRIHLPFVQVRAQVGDVRAFLHHQDKDLSLGGDSDAEPYAAELQSGGTVS